MQLPDEFPGCEKLTPRERQVLELIVQGYTSSAIGDALDMSPRTAETHRERIIDKVIGYCPLERGRQAGSMVIRAVYGLDAVDREIARIRRRLRVVSG
jgi:Bacterial regulatory proteins, luxR family